MEPENIKQTLKEIISGPPTDLYKDESDVRESNIELVEERDVEGVMSREVGSANLFLASAFLATINDIDIPAKDKEDITKLASIWQEAIKKLKNEGYVREKPSSVRQRFEVV